MNIKLLTPHECGLRWSALYPLVSSALSHGQGETNPVDYLNRALNYQAQLWEITDEGDTLGLVITQFLNYNNYKTLHVVALSGKDLPKWIHLYEHIEAFARDNKCTAVESWGRKGWERRLPQLLPGFEEAYVVMRKNLYDEDSKYTT